MIYSILMEVFAAFSAYRSVNNCKYASLAIKITAIRAVKLMILMYCDFTFRVQILVFGFLLSTLSFSFFKSHCLKVSLSSSDFHLPTSDFLLDFKYHRVKQYKNKRNTAGCQNIYKNFKKPAEFEKLKILYDKLMQEYT